MTRGRPATSRLTRDLIVTEALRLTAASGDTFTLRALARHLQVTPMAILHHMGSHDALIHAMADTLLAPIRDKGEGDPQARLAALLLAYADAIRHHPALTLALFRISGPLPAQAQRLTDTVEALLRQAGLAPTDARLRRDILIDWAHGMALAGSPEDPRPALDALLNALNPG